MFTELMPDDAFCHWSKSKRLEKECPNNYEQCKQGSSKFFRLFIKIRRPLTTRPQLLQGWIGQLVFLILIRWIEIYPVDSAIHLLNNLGQENILV